MSLTQCVVNFFPLGTNLEAITTCELCKEKLCLNIDNFDIHELYRTHVQVSHHFTSFSAAPKTYFGHLKFFFFPSC